MSDRKKYTTVVTTYTKTMISVKVIASADGIKNALKSLIREFKNEFNMLLSGCSVALPKTILLTLYRRPSDFTNVIAIAKEEMKITTAAIARMLRKVTLVQKIMTGAKNGYNSKMLLEKEVGSSSNNNVTNDMNREIDDRSTRNGSRSISSYTFIPQINKIIIR